MKNITLARVTVGFSAWIKIYIRHTENTELLPDDRNGLRFNWARHPLRQFDLVEVWAGKWVCYPPPPSGSCSSEFNHDWQFAIEWSFCLFSHSLPVLRTSVQGGWDGVMYVFRVGEDLPIWISKFYAILYRGWGLNQQLYTVWKISTI